MRTGTLAALFFFSLTTADAVRRKHPLSGRNADQVCGRLGGKSLADNRVVQSTFTACYAIRQCTGVKVRRPETAGPQWCPGAGGELIVARGILAPPEYSSDAKEAARRLAAEGAALQKAERSLKEAVASPFVAVRKRFKKIAKPEIAKPETVRASGKALSAKKKDGSKYMDGFFVPDLLRDMAEAETDDDDDDEQIFLQVDSDKVSDDEDEDEEDEDGEEEVEGGENEENDGDGATGGAGRFPRVEQLQIKWLQSPTMGRDLARCQPSVSGEDFMLKLRLNMQRLTASGRASTYTRTVEVIPPQLGQPDHCRAPVTTQFRFSPNDVLILEAGIPLSRTLSPGPALQQIAAETAVSLVAKSKKARLVAKQMVSCVTLTCVSSKNGVRQRIEDQGIAVRAAAERRALENLKAFNAETERKTRENELLKQQRDLERAQRKEAKAIRDKALHQEALNILRKRNEEAKRIEKAGGVNAIAAPISPSNRFFKGGSSEVSSLSASSFGSSDVPSLDASI